MIFRSSFLVLSTLGVLLWSSLAPLAVAQDTYPVRLLELIGPRSITEGAVVNYRARISNTSTRPVGYLWDFGDGIASEGSVVAHRYDTPGTYTVMVVAYNVAGRDTLSTRVTVSPRPAPVAKAAPERSAQRSRQARSPEPKTATTPRISQADVRARLFGREPIQPAASGYSWVIASDLWRERIDGLLLRYRLQGLRVEVMTDTTGPGSPVHRILAGHFDTVGGALIAYSMLRKSDVTASLHAFAPDGMESALAALPQALTPKLRKELFPIGALALADGADAASRSSTQPEASVGEEPALAVGPESGTSQPPGGASEPQAATPPPASGSVSTDGLGRSVVLSIDGISPWAWFLVGVVAALGLVALPLYVVLSRDTRTLTDALSWRTAKKAGPPVGLLPERRLTPATILA